MSQLVFHAIAGALGNDHMAVVEEPVQDSCGDDIGPAKDLPPLVQGLPGRISTHLADTAGRCSLFSRTIVCH